MAKQPVLAYFLVIFFIINIFVVILFPSSDSDSNEYLKLAENLAAGHGYSIDSEEPYLPSFWRTPAYPLILSLFMLVFGNYLGIFGLQVLVNTLTIYISYLIIHNFVETKSQISLLGCLMVFSLPLMSAGARVGPEAINCFLIVLAFWLIFKNKACCSFSAGLLFGIAALFRPENQIVIFILFFTALFLIKKTYILSLLTGIILVLTPWCLRNYYNFGFFSITDPIYSYSALPFGTSGDLGDPVSSKRNDYVRGDVSNDERRAYVELTKKVYLKRWREKPIGIINYKITSLFRSLAYGLEGYISTDWALSCLWEKGKYFRITLRLICKMLYGPIFFLLVLFGLINHLKDEPKLIILLTHFITIMMLWAFICVDIRYFLPSYFLLMPLFFLGLRDVYLRKCRSYFRITLPI